jgi:putative phosphoesterase
VTVKIGLISDVHATPGPVREALTIFQREGVEAIFCAGDVAGYGNELEQTVELLADSSCQAILGNHDLWWLSRCDYLPGGLVERYLLSLPGVIELTSENKNIYMVHASPPGSLMEGIKLLDEHAALIDEEMDAWCDHLQSFPFDVLVVGHTHQVFAEKLGSVLVVNPGSTLFNHTCAILTLPEMDFQVFPLSGKAPVMAWNWGMLYSVVRQ